MLGMGTLHDAAHAQAPAPLIAYACIRGDGDQRAQHICVADSDGSNERAVSDSTDGFDIAPAWSPDGTRLAYVCHWDRDSANLFLPVRDIIDFGLAGYTRNSGGEICVVGADGS